MSRTEAKAGGGADEEKSNDESHSNKLEQSNRARIEMSPARSARANVPGAVHSGEATVQRREPWLALGTLREEPPVVEEKTIEPTWLSRKWGELLARLEQTKLCKAFMACKKSCKNRVPGQRPYDNSFPIDDYVDKWWA